MNFKRFHWFPIPERTIWCSSMKCKTKTVNFTEHQLVILLLLLCMPLRTKFPAINNLGLIFWATAVSQIMINTAQYGSSVKWFHLSKTA